MKYLGYSELTKRLYILPDSARKPKIDITDDVNEYMKSKLQSFRKKLSEITVDEQLKNPGIAIKIFDQHFKLNEL